METSWFMMLLALLLGFGNGGGNDLLDYLPSEGYWTLKGERTPEQLLAELSAPPEPDLDAPPQTEAIRQLMVIRRLGELEHEPAKGKLQELAQSDRPFVAEYAKRALARIEGKDHQPPQVTQDQLQEDLALLPEGSGIVGQVRLPSGGSIDWGQMLQNLGPMAMGQDPAQMQQRIAREHLSFSERIGPVRLDAITLGMDANIGPQQGFVVLIGRGQYNPMEVETWMLQENAHIQVVEGMNVIQPDKEAAVLLPSDQRALLAIGPNPAALPTSVLAKVLKAPPAAFKAEGELAKLLTQVDRTKTLWLVGQVPPMLKAEVRFFQPFDQFTIEVDQQGQRLDAKVVGMGRDAQAIAVAANELRANIAQGLTEMRREQPQVKAQMGVDIQPVIDLLQSVKVQEDGATLTITAEGELSVQPLMMMFVGVRVQAPAHQVHVQRAVPAPAPPAMAHR